MATHDVNARRILWAGVAIALGVALTVGAVFFLLSHWNMPAGTDRVRLPYDLPIEEPALQSAPQPDLARYRAEKQKLLESSAWIDPAHGIVRIPIAQAMDLLSRPAAPAAGPSQVQR